VNRRTIRWAILIGAFGTVVSLVVISIRTPPEPIYRGKPLHMWLAEIDSVILRVAPGQGIEFETTNAAIDAVLSTASEAIPWLRQELETQESSVKTTLRRLTNKLPSQLQMNWLMRRLAPQTAPTLWERHRMAAMASLILGMKAKPLVPELTCLLTSGDNCSLCSFTLARVGVDGVPPLARALTNSSTQFNALQALEVTKVSTEMAVPSLLNLLTNGDGYPSIQNAFLNARGGSQRAVPILRAALSHTNWIVRNSAASTLDVSQNGHNATTRRSYPIRIDKYGNWGTL
jgi:HEAT repeat protein